VQPDERCSGMVTVGVDLQEKGKGGRKNRSRKTSSMKTHQKKQIKVGAPQEGLRSSNRKRGENRRRVEEIVWKRPKVGNLLASDF